jgi:uncharacterized protein YpmB
MAIGMNVIIMAIIIVSSSSVATAAYAISENENQAIESNGGEITDFKRRSGSHYDC